MDDETVAAVIQRHPGSEVFRDLLVAETEEELEALAKDLASRLGKVRTANAAKEPAQRPAGKKRPDGYVEGTASTTGEAVLRRDMGAFLRIRRSEAEAAHQRATQ